MECENGKGQSRRTGHRKHKQRLERWSNDQLRNQLKELLACDSSDSKTNEATEEKIPERVD